MEKEAAFRKITEDIMRMDLEKRSKDPEYAKNNPPLFANTLMDNTPFDAQEDLKRLERIDRATPVSQAVGHLYAPETPEEMSTYDKNISTMEQLTHLNDFRASQQSGVLKGFNAIVGGALSGLGSVGENISLMVDPDYYHSWFDATDAYKGNEASNAFKALKESINTAMPSYEREDSSLMGRAISWNSLRGVVDSSIGFLIPGMAATKVIKGAQLAIRAARTATLATKIGQYAMKAENALVQSGKLGKGITKVGQALGDAATGVGKTGTLVAEGLGTLAMNNAEGVVMAIEEGEHLQAQYIDNEVEKLKSQNPDIDDMEAKQFAMSKMEKDLDFQADVAKHQNQFVNRNRLLIGLDYIGLKGILGKGELSTRNVLNKPFSTREWITSAKKGGEAARAARADLREAGSRAIGKGVGFVDNPIVQATKEGAEEIIQNAFQSEMGYQVRSANNMQTKEDKDAPTDLVDRLISFAGSDQALIEGMMGFVSGPLQRGLAIKTNDLISGDPSGKKRREALNTMYNNQQVALASYTRDKLLTAIEASDLKSEAAADGNAAFMKAVDDSAFYKMAISSMELGTTGELERSLQEVASMSSEDAKELGYSEDYQEKAKDKLEKLNRLEDQYTRLEKYGDPKALLINRTERDVLVQLNKDLSTQIEEKESRLVDVIEANDSLNKKWEELQKSNPDKSMKDLVFNEIFDNSLEAQELRQDLISKKKINRRGTIVEADFAQIRKATSGGKKLDPDMLIQALEDRDQQEQYAETLLNKPVINSRGELGTIISDKTGDKVFIPFEQGAPNLDKAIKIDPLTIAQEFQSIEAAQEETINVEISNDPAQTPEELAQHKVQETTDEIVKSQSLSGDVIVDFSSKRKDAAGNTITKKTTNFNNTQELLDSITDLPSEIQEAIKKKLDKVKDKPIKVSRIVIGEKSSITLSVDNSKMTTLSLTPKATKKEITTNPEENLNEGQVESNNDFSRSTKRVLVSTALSTLGNSHIDKDQSNVPNPNSASRRFFRFVNKHNVRNSNKYSASIMRAIPEVVQKEVDKINELKGGKFINGKRVAYTAKETFWLVFTDKNGKFLTESGTTDVFDPEVNIYAPVKTTLEEWERKNYTIQDSEKDWTTAQTSLSTLRAKIAPLRPGETLPISIIGKTIGINPKKIRPHSKEEWDIARNRNFLLTLKPDKSEKAASRELEVIVATKNTMTLGGIITQVQPGNTFVEDLETGNIYEAHKKRISVEDANTVLSLINSYISRLRVDEGIIDNSEASILYNKEGNPIANRTVWGAISELIYFTGWNKNKEGKDINTNPYTKFHFITPNTLQLGQGTATIFDIQGEEIIPNEEGLQRVKAFLSNSIYQTNSRLVADTNPFYKIERVTPEGVISTKEYTSYKEFLLKDVLFTLSNDTNTPSSYPNESEPTLENQHIIFEADLETIIHKEVTGSTEQAPVSSLSLYDMKVGDTFNMKFTVSNGSETEVVTAKVKKIKHSTSTLQPSFLLQSDSVSMPDYIGFLEPLISQLRIDMSENEAINTITNSAKKVDNSLDYKVIISNNSTDIKPTTQEVQEINEQIINEDQEAEDILNNILNRKDQSDPTARYREARTIAEKTINIDRAVAAIRRVLPNVPIQIVHGLIDGNNWGTFKNGIIYLSDQGESGTEYHEMMHAILNDFIPLKERNAILKMAKTKLSTEFIEYKERFKERGDEYALEELIADKFQEFYLDKPSKVDSWWKRVTNTISNIIDSIKSVFSKEKELSILFQRLSTRVYTQPLKTSYSSIQGSTTRNKIAGQSYKFTQEAVEAVNFFFLEFIRNNAKNGVLSLLDTSKEVIYVDKTSIGNEANLKITNEKGKDALPLSIADAAYIYAKQQIMNTIKYKHSTLSDFLNNPDSSKLTQGVKDRVAAALTEQIKAGVTIIKNWSGNSNSVLSAHAQFLKQYKLDVSEGTLTEEGVTNTQTEESRGRSAGENWGTEVSVSAKANAARNIKLLLGTLPKVKIVDGVITPEKNSLGFQTTVPFRTVFNNLLSAFSNFSGFQSFEKISKVLESLAQKEPAFLVLKKRLKLDMPVQDLSFSDILQISQFVQSIAKNKNRYTINLIGPNGQYTSIDATINSARDNVRKAFLATASTQYSSPYYTTDEVGRIKYNPEAFKSLRIITSSNIGEALTALGIKYSKLSEQQLLSDPDFITKLEYLIKSIIDGNTNSIFSSEELTDNHGDITYILDKELTTGTLYIENSHLGLNGDMIYDNVLNNYWNIVLNAINSFDSIQEVFTHYPHLDPNNSPFLRHSLLLNRMELGERVTMSIVEGNREESSGSGLEFSRLKLGDKIATIINNALLNKYAMIRPADNKLERFIELPTPFISRAIFDNNPQVIRDVFIGYLIDEINRSFDSKEKFKNYTNKGNQNGPYLSILMHALGEEFTTTLKQQSNIEGFLESNPMVRSTIDSIIDKYLDTSVTKLKDLLEKTGVISKQVTNYRNLGLNLKQDTLTEAQLSQHLKYFITNYMISNTEQIKLFIGDTAYFKDLSTEFKRHSATVGTKKILNTSKEINEWIANNLTRMDGAENLTSRVEVAGVSKPIVRTMVVEDVEVYSRNLLNLAEALDKEAYHKLVKDIIGDRPITEEDKPRIIEAISKSSLKSAAYTKMTEGDGQGYISLDEYREFLFRAGDWSDKMEMLYQWEVQEANNIPAESRVFQKPGTTTKIPLTDSMIEGAVFNSLKPQYYGPMAEKTFRPTMYKLSLFPLVPSIIKGTNLEKLSKTMKENKTGVIVHYSANKGVTTKLNPDNSLNSLYDKEGTFGIEHKPLLFQDTFYEFWGIQLDTGNKAKHQVVTGTQMMKQILNSLMNRGTVDGRFESPEKVSSLITEYLTLNSRRLAIGFDNFVSRLGLSLDSDLNMYKVKDKKFLIDTLLREALDRNLPDNIIEQINSLDSQSENINLDTFVNTQVIQNIIMSLADSVITKQKRFGKASYQVAPTGFETSVTREYNDGQLASSDLDFYTKVDKDGKTVVTKMQVYLPWYFKGRFDSSKLDSKLLQLVGFRIPTQGLSSIEAIEIKGFLPASAGDIVVMPSEIVAKAGSDYDIDKLNLYIPNFYYNSEGIPTYISYSEDLYTEYEKTFLDKKSLIRSIKPGTISEMANSILEEAIDKLTATKNLSIDTLYDEVAAALYKVPITPESTSKRIELEELLEAINQADNAVMSFESFEKMAVENRIAEIQAEIATLPENFDSLVAPLNADTLKENADNINSLRGVIDTWRAAPNPYKILDPSYVISAGERYLSGKDAIGVTALMSTFYIMAQMNNIKIDKTLQPKGSKDSISTQINLEHNQENGYTILGKSTTSSGNYYIADLLNQWISAAVDVVKEPFMFDLNATTQTLGTILMLTVSGVDPYTTALFMNQPIIREYLALQGKFESQIAEENNLSKNSKKIQDIITAQYPERNKESGVLTTKQLVQSIKNQNSESSEYRKTQRQVFDDFIRYQEIAKELRTAIQASTYDTKSGGKTLSESFIKIDTTKEKINSGVLKGFSKLMSEGFLAPYYQQVQNMYKSMPALFSSLNSDSFKTINNTLFNILQSRSLISDGSKAQLLDKARVDFLTYLLNSSNSGGTSLVSQFESMFKGKNSIPNRVKKAKVILKRSNPFLEVLYANTSNSIHSIVPQTMRLDTIEKNTITEAWNSLSIPTDPSLKEDLAKFAILQSGLGTNPMSFVEIMPYSLYKKITSDALIIENMNQVDPITFIREFFLSNYNSRDLVPTSPNTRMPFYKTFKVSSKYSNLSSTKLRELQSKGVKVKESLPTVIAHFGESQMVVSTPKMPMAYRDYRNTNQSFTGYGNMALSDSAISFIDSLLSPFIKEEVVSEVAKIIIGDKLNIEKSLNRSIKEGQLAGTFYNRSTGQYTIYVRDNVTTEDFLNYIQGKTDSNSSKQKKAVFEKLENNYGVSASYVAKVLNSTEKITDFLLEHELSHVRNQDNLNYNFSDMMNETNIQIELRATTEALEKVSPAIFEVTEEEYSEATKETKC